MSRKPIDQQQPTECRQAVWDWIRCQPLEFTVSDILYDIRLESSTVRDYLIGLCRAGYLKATYDPAVKRGNSLSVSYTLIRDIGVDAPRVRKDGMPVTQGQGRLQMWNAMRILKSFTTIELAFNSSTDEHRVTVSESKSYCAALCKAGYLVGKAYQTYILLPTKWSGSQPPQIQRTNQVYDPNIRQVVWSRVTGGAL